MEREWLLFGWVCGAGVRLYALLLLPTKSNSWFDPRLQVSDVPRTFLGGLPLKGHDQGVAEFQTGHLWRGIVLP